MSRDLPIANSRGGHQGRLNYKAASERSFTVELPSTVPHAFLNLTDEPGEIVVVYTPGGGHKFYEELGPISRSSHPDRAIIAALFEKYGMTLVGPPLTA